MRNIKINIRNTITDTLNIPKDVSCGAMILTVTGNREVFVENYKGIVEYTSTEIRLQAKCNQVLFQGTDLCIEYYTNEDMKISGIIKQISYL
ncbi:MAG: YabP/YqfC family sporulation protein [Lachnospiraceae bacterium]|nr:YabP/YqfC family sporulation protein [Lachnospiraceae bacterium]